MGNIVHCRKIEDTIETPKMPRLSPEQIYLIKSTWAIPSAKVIIVALIIF